MIPSNAVGVVIPIRSFMAAKVRLSETMDEGPRAQFMQQLAERVVAAAGSLPVAIVTSAPEVEKWAQAASLTVIKDPDSGLNGAAAAGRDFWAAQGSERVIVAHGDLPNATDLAALGRDRSQPIVTLVPCHRDDGTNICSVPVSAPFNFAYGPGSFRRHGSEVRSLGLGLRVVRRPDLAFDIDTPDDLEIFRASNPD